MMVILCLGCEQQHHLYYYYYYAITTVMLNLVLLHCFTPKV
jgi:hypothetical protein